jgi:hypothetical protein
MATVAAPEVKTVARKKGKPARPQPEEPAFGRIELQAAPEWIAELDAVAKMVGLSRSAYIRHACNRQMAADRKMLEGGG